jgi:hypothetical protein
MLKRNSDVLSNTSGLTFSLNLLRTQRTISMPFELSVLTKDASSGIFDEPVWAPTTYTPVWESTMGTHEVWVPKSLTVFDPPSSSAAGNEHDIASPGEETIVLDLIKLYLRGVPVQHSHVMLDNPVSYKLAKNQ